jgi:hypothetical protein
LIRLAREFGGGVPSSDLRSDAEGAKVKAAKAFVGGVIAGRE